MGNPVIGSVFLISNISWGSHAYHDPQAKNSSALLELTLMREVVVPRSAIRVNSYTEFGL
jgi:hypothetical protein